MCCVYVGGTIPLGVLCFHFSLFVYSFVMLLLSLYLSSTWKKALRAHYLYSKKKKSNTQKHTNKIQIKCEKSARSRRMSVQAKELKQLRRWNKKWNLVVRKRKSVREKIFVDSENIISKLVVCYTYTCTYTNASVLKSGKSSNKTKT